MKTVTGRIISAEPLSLTRAATLLSNFASMDNGASQDVSAYLQRAAAAFTELKSIHREIDSSSLEETRPRSDVTRDRNPTVELDGRAKAIDDLVGKGGKICDRKSEAVNDGESIYVREQDEIKEDMKEKKKKSKKKKDEDVVDEKGKNLEDEEKSEERKEKKKKKKKSKKNKEEDVVDEKLEEEQRSEERKEKKSKKKKEEDVVDEKVNEKLEEEQRNEERKERKKKRKSDREIGSEEKKSKKRKKSKESDG